jgi:hypothetical protein
MPTRLEIDPAELPAPMLPYVFMVDLSGDPPRWRYRLIGTEIVARLRVEPTGRFLDDVLGTKYCHYLDALNGDVLVRKHPIYTETLLHGEDGNVLLTKRLLVPLAHLGREPAIVFGAQTYHGGTNAPPYSLVLTDRCEIEELIRHVLE